ncbi:Beta-glucan synthesis-associated protein (SKN1) [Fragilaria crotonensis]|nr:Beta-glucan synthesis-associated protein (SKN1) [Fragilaria crotonensis]
MPFAAADWIDPDTPLDALSTDSYVPRIRNDPKPSATRAPVNITANWTEYPSASPSSTPTAIPTVTTKTFQLVFSDEFNTPGRTFEDGSDPRWTALDKNDYTNDALHYYSPQNAVTNADGELVITTEAADTSVIGYDDVKRQNTHTTKHFRSAMLQSWNKFCFTGGIVEAEAILPGRHDVGGLWPAFWMLGNLARHTYVASSEHVWPWSSTTCTTKSRTAQLISGCANIAHYGMEKRLGRGAPEIDIFEVQPGPTRANEGPFLQSSVGQPFMSASYQVAPGRPANRPGDGNWPGPGQWYEGLKGGANSSLNINFYGNYNSFKGEFDPARQDYWSDAISFNRQLDADYFAKPHVYRLEWDLPSNETDGYLRWYLDGELVLSINGTGVVKADLGSEISSEPMYILLNTAVSKQWGFPRTCPGACPCKNYRCRSTRWQDTCGFSEGFCDMVTNAEGPPEYKINWVRVYQDPTNEMQKVGCSTPERPTRKFIEAHEKLYKTADDVHPLKGIQTGRGACNTQAIDESAGACGGPKRGRCSPGKECECFVGWTGPHCLSHQGFDPILYDQPDKISDLGFIPPTVHPMTLVAGLFGLGFVMLVMLQWRHRLDGWTPIPDGPKEST